LALPYDNPESAETDATTAGEGFPMTWKLAIGAGLACGLALGIAVASERWGGLVPCALCLLERWPYRIGIYLSVLALVLPGWIGRWLLGLVCLCMVSAAGLGVVHVGVEQGAWPSPLPECAAPQFAGGSIAERLAAMPERPAKPCDDPTYPVPFLPVSMAAMNLVYALVIVGGLATLLWRNRRA